MKANERQAPKLRTRLGLTLLRMQGYHATSFGAADIGCLTDCSMRIAYSNLQNLMGRGYVQRTKTDSGTEWRLTDAGRAVAEALREEMNAAYPDHAPVMRYGAVLRDLLPSSGGRPRKQPQPVA